MKNEPYFYSNLQQLRDEEEEVKMSIVNLQNAYNLLKHYFWFSYNLEIIVQNIFFIVQSVTPATPSPWSLPCCHAVILFWSLPLHIFS